MAVNASNLVNFGTSGLNVGDWTYSAYPLSAPAYLPLNNDVATYLTSSYPALGAIYAPTTVAYSASSVAVPPVTNPNNFTYRWSGIFGNKTFFLYNLAGNLLVSTDLVNWISRGIPVAFTNAAASYNNPASGGGVGPAGADTNWGAICYGNGKLVAVRPQIAAGTVTLNTSAMSSDNGVTWTFGGLPSVSLGSGPAQATWTGVTYGDGTFTAYGYVVDSGGTVIYAITAQSTDGVNWFVKNSQVWALGGGTTYPSFITYGNGTFVMGTNTSQLYYSSNNFTNTAGAGAGVQFTSCIYGGGLFVATMTGSSTSIYTSPNGFTWTPRTVPNQTWSSVAYSNGYYVAVGGTGAASTVIATSANGTTWASQTVPSATLRGGVAGGLGKFFYQNDSGATLTQVNLSAAASTFTLPMVTNPPTGNQAYIKAT